MEEVSKASRKPLAGMEALLELSDKIILATGRNMELVIYTGDSNNSLRTC